MTTMQRELITIAEAAHRTGWKTNTIWVLISRGHLTRHEAPKPISYPSPKGFQLLVDYGELCRYIAEHPK